MCASEFIDGMCCIQCHLSPLKYYRWRNPKSGSALYNIKIHKNRCHIGEINNRSEEYWSRFVICNNVRKRAFNFINVWQWLRFRQCRRRRFNHIIVDSWAAVLLTESLYFWAKNWRRSFNVEYSRPRHKCYIQLWANMLQVEQSVSSVLSWM